MRSEQPFAAVVLAGSVLAGFPSWGQQAPQAKPAQAPLAHPPAKALALELPDLRVQEVWIESGGQRVTRPLAVAEKVLLVCRWANAGAASTATFKVGYYVDGRLIGSRGTQANAPAAGRQAIHAGAEYAADRAGKHRYECVLDYDHALRERDTTNNRASLTFDVVAKAESALARHPVAGIAPPALRQGPPFTVTTDTLTVTGQSYPIVTPVPGFTPVAATVELLTVTGTVYTPVPAGPFTPVSVTVQTLTVTGKP